MKYNLYKKKVTMELAQIRVFGFYSWFVFVVLLIDAKMLSTREKGHYSFIIVS